MSPNEYVVREILTQIEAFGSTCIANVVVSVESPYDRWGVRAGDWLVFVRSSFKALEEAMEIEPVELGNAIWYRYPNVLQRIVNSVNAAYEAEADERA